MDINVNLRNIALTWGSYSYHVILVVGYLVGIEVHLLLLSSWKKSANKRSELLFLSEKWTHLIFKSLNVSWQSTQLSFVGHKLLGFFMMIRYALNSHHSIQPGVSGSFSIFSLSSEQMSEA